MPFIYPALSGGPMLIIDGIVANNSVENIFNNMNTGKLGEIPNHYITPDAQAQTSPFYYMDEDKNVSQTFLNGYVYDTIKGYLITNITIPQNTLLYKLTITAALAGSKIYISPSSMEIPNFTKNYITLPIAATNANGYISVDNNNVPIVTSIDYIDYDSTQEIILVTDKFNSDINLTNLILWTETEAAGMLVGNLAYTLEPISLEDVTNTLFFKSTSIINCNTVDDSNIIALHRTFNGTNSAYFETLYLSEYFDPNSLVWDTTTITTLKNNAIKAYNSQNGATYEFILTDLPNTAVDYIIWGMSISNSATIDDPTVEKSGLYFITIDAPIYGQLLESTSSNINRSIDGQSSATFTNLYLTTETGIIEDPPSDIKELKTNYTAIFNSNNNDTYQFFLQNITNEMAEYAIWGLSTKPKGNSDDAGWIGAPTVVETLYSAETTDCLSGDTLITLIDGSKKRLDEITMDDIVLSENHEPANIVALVKNLYWPNHVKYYFDNGTIIDEVREHFFYNVEQGFYASLKNWNPGEHAIDINGNQTAYLYKEIIEEETEKFGIWTNTGSYYANDLLSSSLSNNKKYIDNASIEQIMDMMLTIDNDLLMSILESGVAHL